MRAKKRNHKRRKPRFQRRTQPGAAPGIIHPHPESPPPVFRITAYSEDNFVEEQVDDVARLRHFRQGFRVVWISVEGLGDANAIAQLGESFGLHPLALEDVVNVHQRAKVEAYHEHLFIVARIVHQAESMVSEQISLFLGQGFVITFQERSGDCFDPVRERLRKSGGRVRGYGADYLAYSLLDACIDTYYPVVDRYADRLDDLEDVVATWSQADVTHHIQEVRNDLLVLRRSLRPHRDAFNELIRDEHPLISAETKVFLRDCHDHTVQLTELLEMYRDACADLRDYHLAMISTRMNEIMKVLTIISTIFIPLSFVAGVYGMNFDTKYPMNMPELGWQYGYFFSLGVMAAVAVGMLIFFVRKGWIGPQSTPPRNGKEQGHSTAEKPAKSP